MITARQRKTAQKKDRFLKCYEQTNGDIARAAILADVGRASHYRWLDDDLTYKNKLLEIEKKIEQKIAIEANYEENDLSDSKKSLLSSFIETADVAVRSRDSLYVYGEIAEANDHWILFKHVTVKNYRTNRNRFFDWYLLPMHSVDEMYPVNSYKKNKKSMNDSADFCDYVF